MKSDVYQIITDRIIQLLESGTVPWHQPWRSVYQWPRNHISQKAYRGVNSFLLNAAGYASPFWLTFKQVKSLGGQIRKGEQSFPVVFWKIFRAEDDPEERRIPFLRYYNVFNVSQCEGIDVPVVSENDKPSLNVIAKCEELVAGMPAPPTITHDGNHACYTPTLDSVTMPDPTSFDSRERYYCTLFHELVHATGHVTRLNRKGIIDSKQFSSEKYSQEELVAEMGAAFLCGHCSMENHTIDHSASYIHHWLGKLKNDRKLIVLAAAQAQKACDFIRNIKYDDPEGPSDSVSKEYKVVALRECPLPDSLEICDTPEKAVDYWNLHVTANPYFNPECECFVVLILNTRRRIKGHQLISTGTMDTVLVHPREVFRGAVIAAASALIVMHNHPSGESTPSEADIKITRDLIRGGQLLKIEILDHVIVGKNQRTSLRELGYLN